MGGLIASLITACNGSGIFNDSIVCYPEETKQKELDVKQAMKKVI